MSIEWREPTPLPSAYKSTKNDYDLSLLPKPIMEAAKEIARFSQVPIASPAVVGLSCVATAIGKKAIVVEKQGLEHHPSLFFTLIAASGERKSPIFNIMKQPLDDWCKGQMDKYHEEKRYAQSRNQIIDSRIAGIKNLSKKKNADFDLLQQELMDNEEKRVDIPPTPSLYTTDTTEERLFQKMYERGEAYAVMSGEGRGALDQILGKYTSGGGTGDALYLAGITGDTVTRDRIGKGDSPEELIMYSPCLNVCIMVQPDKYQEVASHPSLRESGALARIWSIHLPSLVGGRFEKEDESGLNLVVLDKYNNLINSILEAKPPEDSTGKEIHRATLSLETIKARREFHNLIEGLMAEGEAFEDYRDIASKCVSQTIKTALILHIADNPQLLNQSESVLEIGTWYRAEALGKFHLKESVRIQKNTAEDKSIAYSRKILSWITRNNFTEFTARDVQQRVRPQEKVDRVKSILDYLCEYDFLLNLGSKYIVNPKIL